VIGLEPDAIIVSDLGLMRWVHDKHPHARMHASIQAGTCNSRSARVLKSLGASRVVLERILSIDEARHIRNAGVEIEMFAFGPMCYSFDSLCFLGQYFNGKTCGNMCMKRWASEGGRLRYLFMKYQSGLGLIPSFAESGIDALKIEGRTRSSAYVRRVVSTFRKAIDEYEANGSLGSHPEWHEELRKAALYFEVNDGFLGGTYERVYVPSSFSTKSKLAYVKDLITQLCDKKSIRDTWRKLMIAVDVDA